MLKKLSTIGLIGLLALPGTIQAASTTDLSSKIDQLTQELAQLRDQMEEQEEAFEEMDERAEGWDLASRVQITGDIRSRFDMHQGETADAFTMEGAVGAAYMMAGGSGVASTPGTSAFTNELGAYMGSLMMGGTPYVTESEDWENDTFFTTRLRMNMRVKATENIEVKARVVGYKAWGMQSNPAAPGISTPYYQNSMTYDGTVARMPSDSNLNIDRAFMNWNNIGGAPVWFSIGRRPTTDGPPNHLRMGLDKRQATPGAYMDYPFDGISMGYAYANLFGMNNVPGRIRFCAGRGYEDGVSDEDSGINDTDFAGLSWDITKKGDRFVYLQSFAAINIFNVPGDNTMYEPAMANFMEMQAGGTGSFTDAQFEDAKTLDRQIMGDIYHTTAVYMDKISSINYFGTFGWSMTDPSGDMDEWGQALGGDAENNKHGYAVFVGGRYDLDDLGLKFGAEYNWGSENWLAFSPGHDDMYVSKLQTRGSVYELYMIYDLPSGEAISKYGKAFMRIGYQHYDYDYTGSGNWMSNPVDLSNATEMANMQSVAPLESVDQIYLTLEAYF